MGVTTAALRTVATMEAVHILLLLVVVMVMAGTIAAITATIVVVMALIIQAMIIAITTEGTIKANAMTTDTITVKGEIAVTAMGMEGS